MQIIPDLLLSETALKRDAIIAKLQKILPTRGFKFSGGAAVPATKKALSKLLAEGRITSPRTGWYALPATEALSTETEMTEAILSSGSQEEASAEQTGKLIIQREMGDGPESVYVYYQDAYLQLAQTNRSLKWECKVGWTVGEPDARILGQGALTCFPHPPVIGLLIRTHDGRHLERIIHAALSYAGVKISSGGGSEWFLTSPELIAQWVTQFNASVKMLK